MKTWYRSKTIWAAVLLLANLVAAQLDLPSLDPSSELYQFLSLAVILAARLWRSNLTR